MKGSQVAKDRLLVILGNLGGTVRVADACRRLGVGRTLFWMHRKAVLVAALKALEPGSPGRPVREPSREQLRIIRLEDKIRQLEEDLTFARAREELALLVPRTARVQKKRRRPRAPTSGTKSSVPRSDSNAAETPGPTLPNASA